MWYALYDNDYLHDLSTSKNNKRQMTTDNFSVVYKILDKYNKHN